MGGLLDKPIRTKNSGKDTINNISYGYSSMQGWREHMEDAMISKLRINDDLSDHHYFAVFDGHAGAFAASYCQKKLLETIVSSPDFKVNPSRTIERSFIDVDNQLKSASTERSGTTAVLSIVNNESIIIANLGDSRCVLSKNGLVCFASRDHTPLDPEESLRIQKSGGRIEMGRVNGNLAVSRAIGDYQYKLNGKNVVSNIPDVFVISKDENYDFMVLACDGIWNVMTNEEICSYIEDKLMVVEDLEVIANDLVEMCLYKGSRDNMSIIIVKFNSELTPKKDALDNEKKLNNDIYNKMKDLIETYPDNNYYSLLQQLKFSEPLENINFESKRFLMDQIYSELKNDHEELETKMLLDKIEL